MKVVVEDLVKNLGRSGLVKGDGNKIFLKKKLKVVEVFMEVENVVIFLKNKGKNLKEDRMFFKRKNVRDS